MFLTTEPMIVDKSYVAIRVIFGTTPKAYADLNFVLQQALAAREQKALELGADGVIGVHHSICESLSGTYQVSIMGTAIKFQEP